MRGNTKDSHIQRFAFHVILTSALVGILSLSVPLYLLQIYDRVIPTNNVHTLIYLSVAAVVAIFFQCALDVVRSIYLQRMAADLDKHFGDDTFRLELSGNETGFGSTQPLRDLATARTFVSSRGFANLCDLPFVPLFLILMAFVHHVLFWITVIGSAALITLAVITQLVTRRTEIEAAEQSAVANLNARGFSRNVETIRAMGMQSSVAEAWGEAFASAVNLQSEAGSKSVILGGIAKATRLLLQIAILGVGGWLVLAGEMTAGMIFASSLVSGRALQPLDQLIGGWRQTAEAFRAWFRLKKSLSSRANSSKKVVFPISRGSIQLNDVTYLPSHDRKQLEPIFNHLNLKISGGEAIAVVGPSRAGKSTLARLLVNAIRPTSGSIQIDGADLTTWGQEQLGKQIGYLGQNIQLIPGTIAQNVSRFEPDATDEDIVAAARRAHAHDLILSLPDGYQTRISVSNIGLSGGEAQRIGLARAFYGNPRILVLDEPNANLDRDGEAALELAMAMARSERTTIVIVTHRMSIASSCDRVLALRNGKLEAFGPAKDILAGRPKGHKPNIVEEYRMFGSTDWKVGWRDGQTTTMPK